MTIGTYLFAIEKLDCRFHENLKYDDDEHNYKHTRHVQCVGVVRDDRGSTELLIDGKYSLHDFTCHLTLEMGDAWELSNAGNSQTRRHDTSSRPSFISKIIGNMTYERGRDSGLGFAIKPGIYATACLNKDIFSMLWECGVARRVFQAFYIDVFGTAMKQSECLANTTYHWETDGGDRNLLYICGFGYSFA